MTFTLEQLYHVIISRKDADPAQSYVASLFKKGAQKIAQKVGEEGVETALAATSGTREQTVSESADLLFHLLVLLAEKGIEPSEVLAELEKRHGTSGLEEKANRK